MSINDFDIISALADLTDTSPGCWLLLFVLVGLAALAYARSLG